MSAKGCIDRKNVDSIAKEIKIRIEIEKNNTLYRFEPFRTRGERFKVEEKIDFSL